MQHCFTQCFSIGHNFEKKKRFRRALIRPFMAPLLGPEVADPLPPPPFSLISRGRNSEAGINKIFQFPPTRGKQGGGGIKESRSSAKLFPLQVVQSFSPSRVYIYCKTVLPSFFLQASYCIDFSRVKCTFQLCVRQFEIFLDDIIK